jgi:hypothetical protein
MADTIKDKVQQAGHAVAEKAKEVGHKISAGAEKAVDWVKEKTHSGGCTGKDAGVEAIREHMDVVASCGTKVGTVDHHEGNTIKLTKSASPDGQHHFIPTAWVARVDQHVHLKKNSEEVKREWQTEAASCGTCGA